MEGGPRGVLFAKSNEVEILPPPYPLFCSFFLSFFLFFFFFFLERVCGSENVLRIVLLFEHNRHRDDTAYK